MFLPYLKLNFTIMSQFKNFIEEEESKKKSRKSFKSSFCAIDELMREENETKIEVRRVQRDSSCVTNIPYTY